MKDYVRVQDVLEAYWKEVNTGSSLPHEDVIDPDKLAIVWDDCFLARITKNHGYIYEYLGANLIEAFGDDFNTGGVENLISSSAHETVVKFDEVITNKELVDNEGEFTNSNNQVIKFRQVLLPFVDHEEKVTFILGGMRWKPY